MRAISIWAALGLIALAPAAGAQDQRTIVLTDADAGTSRSVSVGDAIEVRLETSLGTGFGWTLKSGGEGFQVDMPKVERATPPAFEPIAEYPRESAACLHLFALLILEEMGAEPMLEAEDFAEFEPLVRQCVDGLVGEARKDRNPTEYIDVLDCIERAQTSPAVEACETAPANQVRDMNRRSNDGRPEGPHE